jgi:hypothetical protein
MSGWSISPKDLIAKAKADLGRATQDATAELFRRAVERSPVLSGKFVANWRLSQGAVDPSTTDDLDPGKGAAYALVEKVKEMKPGGVIFFTNSLPYAALLEHGWSIEKAPEGMVNVTMTEWPSIVEEAVRKNG